MDSGLGIKGYRFKNYIVVVLDDILIYSNIEEDHGPHLCVVTETLRNHNFKLNDKKCAFGCKKMEDIGYRVDTNNIC
jgi:hypothetical protein